MISRWWDVLLFITAFAVQGHAQDVNTASYPDIDSDMAQLDEMANKYRVEFINASFVEECLKLLADRKGADYQTYTGLVDEYKPVWQSATPQGALVKSKLTTMKNVWTRFDQAAQDFTNLAAEDAPRLLKEAATRVDEAEAQKAPGLVVTARQQVEEVKQYIRLFEAIDPQSSLAQELKAGVEQINQKIAAYDGQKAEQASLALEQKRAPSDVYTGGDKEEIRRMIIGAWEKRYPEDKILGLHFSEKNWERRQNWNANEAVLYKNDTSSLGVKVAVLDAANNEVVNLYWAFVNKDNLDGSLNVGVDTKTSYSVERMLKKNY